MAMTPTESNEGHKKMFPCLNTLEDEVNCGQSSGELLCSNLKILAVYRNVLKEKQRLKGQAKRKDKEKSDEPPAYKFTPNMFTYPNTDAFAEAMYLLFTCLNAKEADVRFRDCWPIFEIKMIGAFRRVCLEWMKELIEENPRFFRELKIEALSGLLVNPGGDRFISMMRQFCRLVMFKIANRKKRLGREQVLYPPIPTADTEVVYRQLAILYKKKQSLSYDAGNLFADSLTAIHVTKDRSMVLEDIDICDEDFATLRNYLNKYPQLKRITDEEWEHRQNYVSSEKFDEDFDNGCIADPIHTEILKDLKAHIEEISSPMSFFNHVVQDYDKIWYILGIDKLEIPCMDCSKFPKELLLNEHGDLSLNTLMYNIKAIMNSIINNEFLNKKTPSALLTQLERATLRLNFLDVLKVKVNQRLCDGPLDDDLPGIRDNLEKFKCKYEGFDWSFMSESPDRDLDSLFDLSPIRIFDVTRRTGITPGICKFLDCSSANSSGEHNGDLRNKADMTKPGRKLNLSKDSSEAGSPRKECSITQLSYQEDQTTLLVPREISATATPVSSHASKRHISLHQSLFNESFSSFGSSIKKSVSFSDSPGLSTPPNSSPATSEGDNRWRLNFETSTPTSTFKSSNPDISDVSDSPTDEQLVSSAVQERLQRLMESAASSTPRSFINLGETPPDNDLEQTLDSFGNDLEREIDDDFISSFESISVTHDWVDVKGIMETSQIELCLNSDSD